MTPAGEAEWQRVQRYLSWADGFALVFLFTDHPAVATLLRERVADLWRARVTRLRREVPERPEALTERVLPGLLAPTAAEQALGAPVWLELTARDLAGRWTGARMELLARLNEQRERLRSVVRAPLVLVLPAEERAAVRAQAPDLWSIRDLTVITEDWIPADPPTAPRPLFHAQPLAEPTAPPEATEWERVRAEPASGGSARAALRAATAWADRGRFVEAAEAAGSAVRLARAMGDDRLLALALGELGEVLQAQGRFDRATEAQTESLTRALDVLGRGDDPDARRAVSVAVSRVGRLHLEQGRHDPARAAFSEAIARFRDARVARPGPSTDADLSTALADLGRMELRLARWTDARPLLAESLALVLGAEPLVRSAAEANLGEAERGLGRLDLARDHFRAAVEAVPRASVEDSGLEVQRRLAAALGQLADVEHGLGRLEEARALAEESLAVEQALPQVPIVMRERSITLNLLGQVEHEFGLASAPARYRESLELTRRLWHELGDTPESRRDLAVALANVGRVDRDRRAFREATRLMRTLLDRDSPGAMRDLALTLLELGELDPAHQSESYREAVGLLRTALIANWTPLVVHDLAAALLRLGADLQERHRWEEAAAARREALSLAREVATRGTPDALTTLAAALNAVGQTERWLGRWDAAYALDRECVEVVQRGLAAIGETPELLGTLAAALHQVAESERQLGRHGDAARHASEGEAIECRLRDSGRAARG
jgi:tetratricopeptide (TPR) repeat protein